MYCILSILYYILSNVYCILSIVYCILYNVIAHCTLSIVYLYYILSILYCLLYIVYCILYNVYCMLSILYFILYIVYGPIAYCDRKQPHPVEQVLLVRHFYKLKDLITSQIQITVLWVLQKRRWQNVASKRL